MGEEKKRMKTQTICPRCELPVASVGQWHDHRMRFLDILYMFFKDTHVFLRE